MLGDIRIFGAQEFVVLERQRGRAGEERTVFILGRFDSDGSPFARETRGRTHVATCKLVRRGPVFVRSGPLSPWVRS